MKLENAQITKLLPDIIGKKADVEAMSEALRLAVIRLIDCADGTRLFSAVDTLDDEKCNALATQLRTFAYKEGYSIDIKRALIKNTLVFYSYAGTPKAVNDIIETVFGDGYIEEWFDYSGTPHHFRVYTTNPSVTTENVSEFIEVVSSVKRKSSWLDNVYLSLSAELNACFGLITHIRTDHNFTMSGD